MQSGFSAKTLKLAAKKEGLMIKTPGIISIAPKPRTNVPDKRHVICKGVIVNWPKTVILPLCRYIIV